MLVFFPTLATVGVDKKVPERRKYGMSHPSGFESEKEKDRDFQPTKKQRMKPSGFRPTVSLTALRCSRDTTHCLKVETVHFVFSVFSEHTFSK